MRKTSELFLLFNTGVDFSLRNNFANSGSFAKVSVPVHIYNSYITQREYKIRSCLTSNITDPKTGPITYPSPIIISKQL